MSAPTNPNSVVRHSVPLPRMNLPLQHPLALLPVASFRLDKEGGRGCAMSYLPLALVKGRGGRGVRVRPRSGVILVLVLLMLTLCASIAAQVASRTIRLTGQAADSQRELQSRWAMVSLRRSILNDAQALLTDRSSDPISARSIAMREDSILLGGVRYQLILQDESAKAPIARMLQSKNQWRTSLGSDSGFGIQRYELGNATALNRRRHERIQRIDDNGRRRKSKKGTQLNSLRLSAFVACHRDEQAATVMHPTNRYRRSPPHVSIHCVHCPLQNPFMATGLSVKYEVKTAVTDAADCKAGMAGRQSDRHRQESEHNKRFTHLKQPTQTESYRLAKEPSTRSNVTSKKAVPSWSLIPTNKRSSSQRWANNSSPTASLITCDAMSSLPRSAKKVHATCSATRWQR